VQRCPADAEPKGTMPESSANTSTTATIIRRGNASLLCAVLKRCTLTPRITLSLKTTLRFDGKTLPPGNASEQSEDFKERVAGSIGVLDSALLKKSRQGFWGNVKAQ